MRTGNAVAAGVFCLLILSTGCKHPPQTEAPASPATHVSQVERLDPALDTLIDGDSRWHPVANGFTWVEGPVWIAPNTLMFADIPSNSIRAVGADGKVSIWLQPSGYRGSEPYGGKEPGTNGMTLDSKGRLTVAGHAARNIMRFETMDPHGKVTILADSYQGKPLNSPNDLVYGRDGSLYFTDPPYGLRTQSDTDPAKKLKVNGVYRIPNAVDAKPGVAPQRNKLQLLISDLPRPNGIAFSPDYKWLYIADSGAKKWMRYAVKKDGTLEAGTLFLDASGDHRPGGPDGMKVDIKGNLYSSGPGGIWIISPEGKHLGTILTPKNASNLAWGGDDAMTLYATVTDAVYSIRVKTPGFRP